MDKIEDIVSKKVEAEFSKTSNNVKPQMSVFPQNFGNSMMGDSSLRGDEISNAYNTNGRPFESSQKCDENLS